MTDLNAAPAARREETGRPEANEPATVLPYAGDRPFEHYGPQGAPHTTRTYASDSSGSKTYHFNAAGFRGESLAADARLRVFVCGASYAFGTGLNWEETWAFRLKSELGARLDLEPERVNVLNFSQSLASADYVSRTLLAQCSVNRPDLVIASYSDMKRAEYFVDGAPTGVLPRRFPWYRRLKALRPGWQQRLQRMLPGLPARRDAGRRLDMWNHYSGLYSRETGVVRTLTSMLLLQSFCRAEGIDCLISWVQHAVLRDERIRANPAIAPLIDLLDPRCFCDFAIVDSEICSDLAADDIHPGVDSNRVFAGRLADAYERNYRRQSVTGDVERILAASARR